MAYSDFLVKVGNYTIPLGKIKADTYKSVRTVIDLDSYRSADGVLIRNALPHVPYKLEMNLIPMYNADLQTIMQNIRSNFISSIEKKANVTFYDTETDQYITQEMYMPDINFQIYGIFDGRILYDETTIKFIGY